ncbi:hypothetical protein ACFLTL_00320 [Chloroflexota bacterium]
MAKYQFLRTASTIFRVLGWIALVGGVVGSILLAVGIVGLSIYDGVSVAAGAAIIYAVVGIVISVLYWVSLLVAAELLHLFIDMEKNTRETAERLRADTADQPSES